MSDVITAPERPPCENAPTTSHDDEPKIVLNNDPVSPKDDDTSSSLDGVDPDYPEENESLNERNSQTESWI